VVRLYVENWRCVEEAEVSLEPVTAFVGRNSTGKSSLAYAPYSISGTDRLPLQAAEALMRSAGRFGAESSPSVKALTPSQLFKEIAQGLKQS